MIQEGVLATEPPIERMYALHVWPGLPSGTIASRAGTLMAAAGFFHARFIGHGGHAAMPHTTTDPLLCLSSALTSVQTVVARNTAPVEAAVVSTTFVSGGSAYNIIPDEAVMGGERGRGGWGKSCIALLIPLALSPPTPPCRLPSFVPHLIIRHHGQSKAYELTPAIVSIVLGTRLPEAHSLPLPTTSMHKHALHV